MNTPGFTAESALSMASRAYRLIRLRCPEVGRFPATEVRVAAISGGSGGGSGFTCGGPDFPGECSCMGPIDSADCKAMEKNCAGPIHCGWAVDNCTCDFTPLTRPPITKFPGRIGGILTKTL
jgi:hypothetical protein